MSLNLAMGNALSGLKANQRAISVLSHNIANANTPGYSRQIVNQSAMYIDGIGSGVKIDDVSRAIDSFLRRSIISQGSMAQSNTTINDYHERIQIMLGEPGAQNSLDETLTSFYNNLQLMSETPTSASLRTNAVTMATEFARQVSDLTYRLEDLRFEADRQIGETVGAINGILRRLDQVNVALASATVLGTSLAGLEDERDMLLNDLSKKINITTFYEETGAVQVFTGNGVALVDSVRHELVYRGIPSADTLANDGTLGAVELVTYDTLGNPAGNPIELITGGKRGDITTVLTGGALHGLQQVRDEIIPEFLLQLDTLAATMRDTMNAVHNKGSSVPPAQMLTGTRMVTPSDQYNWTGTVRIAALLTNGSPVPSGYPDEIYTGWRPLDLDLGSLDSGDGKGKPTIQTIIDEINNHFRGPSAKAKVGNLNSIELTSNVTRLPTSPTPQFTFDFDIENISGSDSKFFVTGVTVLNDAAANITNVTQNVPRLALDSAATYTTTAGSNQVVVRTTLPPNVGAGQTIYLSQPPAGLYNGIPHTELGGYFQVVNVSGNDITIEVATLAGAGPAIGVAGMEAVPAYSTIPTGEQMRTQNSGAITVDLTADPTSDYYDISVDVGVLNADGSISTSTITYRVKNNEFNLMNDRYSPSSVTGGGALVVPNTTQDALRAILVDENGTEITKINGVYPSDARGYLKIVGGNSEYRVAIDELDSQQLGKLDGVPPQPGTNRGFSYFFELNNMFKSNQPTATGDTVFGSAYKLALEDRLQRDPNLIAYARLERTPTPANQSERPLYTYTLFSGNNANAQALAAAGSINTTFAEAGGLPASSITFKAYVGELLGYMSSRAAEAQSSATTADTLLQGFIERSEAISNVNLDEELANTIIYQNSYSAAARVISVVDELFSDLLQVV